MNYSGGWWCCEGGRCRWHVQNTCFTAKSSGVSFQAHVFSFSFNADFIFPFIFISWKLITLQYCSGFCHTLTCFDMYLPWIYMCSPSRSPLPPPSPSHPSGSSQCTSPEHLSHASSLGWWSISPLILSLFQCYSLRTSHPRLFSQSPKVCSVHLCLFFFLHIGLSLPSFKSPYIWGSILYWSLSFWLTHSV